jgi:hypothetical protein
VGNGANYVWSVGSAGKFIVGPTGGTSGTKKCNFSGNTATRLTDGKCDAVSDRVDYSGVGTFSKIKSNVPIVSSTGTKNLTSPLTFIASGPHLSPHVSYDGATNTTLGQVNPDYPQFICTNAADGTTIDNNVTLLDANHNPIPPLPPYNCRPTITLTMKATLYGPDTLQVLNGDTAFCSSCNATISTADANAIKFVTDGVKFLTTLEHVVPKFQPILQPIINIGTLFLSSLTAPPDPICPGKQVLGLLNAKENVNVGVALAQDPNNSPGIPAVIGTIVVNQTIAPWLTGYPQNATDGFPIPQDSQKFDFTGTGNDLGNFSIITDQCNGSCGKGSNVLSGLTTGATGGSRTITETGFPTEGVKDPDYLTDPLVCTGEGESRSCTHPQITGEPFWYTQDVSCNSVNNIGSAKTDGALGPTTWSPSPGTPDQHNPSNRSGSVTVGNLADNDTLICTFQNGIYEIENH